MGFLQKGPGSTIGKIDVETIDGELYAVYNWYSPSGYNGASLMHWDGSDWQPVPGSSWLKWPAPVLGERQQRLVVASRVEPLSQHIFSVGTWDGTTWDYPFPLLTLSGYPTAMASVGSTLYVAANNSIMRASPSGPWQSINTTGGLFGSMASIGADLYIGGKFITINGLTANHVARFDGVTWHTLGGGLSGPVSDVDVRNNELMLAGGFTFAINPNGGVIGLNHVASWNGTAWHNVGGLPGPPQRIAASNNALAAIGPIRLNLDPVPIDVYQSTTPSWKLLTPTSNNMLDDAVICLAVHQGVPIAGGYFSKAGTTTLGPVAAWKNGTWESLNSPEQLGVNTLLSRRNVLYSGSNGPQNKTGLYPLIRAYDGSEWTEFGGVFGYQPWVRVLENAPTGIVAAGNFASIDGISSASIAMHNGSQWTSLGNGLLSNGLPGSVANIAFLNDTLYAFGVFDKSGLGTNVTTCASWNGQDWEQAPLPSAFVHFYEIISLGEYIYAIDYSTNGALRVLSFDGDQWQTLFTSNATEPPVYPNLLFGVEDALHVVMGQFSSTSAQIYRLDSSGKFNPLPGATLSGLSGWFNAAVATDDGFCVGGSFLTAGPVVSANFAHYKLCPPCYPDCDGSSALNILDFICFGNAYFAGQPYADCDKNTIFNVFDYTCFSNAYTAGCP